MKHRRFLTWIFLLTVALCGLILAGCGQKGSEVAKNNQGGKGTERVLMVGDRDAIRTLDSGFLLVEKTHIAETLLEMDANYQLKPLLAVSWQQVAPTTWELVLREGVRFHDGSSLTAAEVVRALERALKNNPRVKELTKIASLQAVDGKTLRVVTAQPNPLLPEGLADANLFILSPASYDEKGQLLRPIGTGPFKFSSWDQATGTVTVEKNPDYWGKPAGLDRMVFRPIPDANTRALALEKGEIDFTFDLPYAEIERLQKVPGVEIELYPVPRIYRLEMNMSREPFRDPKVRQALNYAIDRTGIVRSVLHGCGEPAIGPFMPGTPWRNQDIESIYQYDPDKARTLLSEAGWVDKNGDGVREKDGIPFAITIMTWASRPGMPPMAEALQAQFREVGIQVQVQILEYGAIYDRVKRGDWDMVLATFQTSNPYQYLLSVYGSGGSQNVARYSNAAVDKLLAEAAMTVELEKRYSIYRQIQEIVTRDTSVINVACYKVAVGRRACVKGFRFNPNAHDLHTSLEMTVEK